MQQQVEPSPRRRMVYVQQSPGRAATQKERTRPGEALKLTAEGNEQSKGGLLVAHRLCGRLGRFGPLKRLIERPATGRVDHPLPRADKVDPRLVNRLRCNEGQREGVPALYDGPQVICVRVRKGRNSFQGAGQREHLLMSL